MYYTICEKTVVCPYWNISVTLQGKYKIVDDSCMVHLINATCPVIENNKLPLNKQDSSLKHMKCPESTIGCDLLSSFKPIINIDKDGYSQ